MPEPVSDPSASRSDALASGAPAAGRDGDRSGAAPPQGEPEVGSAPGAPDEIPVTVPAPPPALTDAIGGPLGVAESAVPAAVFVAVYTAAGQDVNLAAIVAVALGALLTLARVVRGQTVQFALSGLAGIALAGFVVSRTGKAEDFFLPGLLLNLAYAMAYLVSIVIRWPLIGVAISLIGSQGMGWRKDPALMKVYTRASWIWVALFVIRLAVQLPLYAAGALVALGVAKVAMGIPLFALGLWLTWLLVGRTALTPRGGAGTSAA